MKQKSLVLFNTLRWVAGLLVVIAINGCTTIKLVGDYDEKIDTGVTALQKDTETYLLAAQSAF